MPYESQGAIPAIGSIAAIGNTSYRCSYRQCLLQMQPQATIATDAAIGNTSYRCSIGNTSYRCSIVNACYRCSHRQQQLQMQPQAMLATDAALGSIAAIGNTSYRCSYRQCNRWKVISKKLFLLLSDHWKKNANQGMKKQAT